MALNDQERARLERLAAGAPSISPKGHSQRCVFCGNRPLSKEHIWPNWLRKHLKSGAPYNMHTASLLALDGGKAFWGERKDRPRTGSTMSQKLRVVCPKCNNRWMSVLQTECKPILLPFVAGEWVGLDDREQQKLAAWATMFTMVWECRDPRTQATPFSERELFRQTLVPPPSWKIWIGRAVDAWEGATNHIAWLAIDTDDIPGLITPTMNTQVTAWCLGSLFLMTFSSTSKYVCEEENKFAKAHGLEVLWPLQSRQIDKPVRALDHGSANAVVRAILPPEFDQRPLMDISNHRRPKP